MSEQRLNDEELEDVQGEALPDREVMTLLPMDPLGGEFVQLDPPIEQAGPGEDT